MRVAMYYNNNDVRIQESAVPKINDDEILVRVMASGICGSDVMEWYRIKKAPIVLGHEISGVVEKAGNNVKNFRIGDRVFVTHHVPCMVCHYCKTGHHTACDTLHRTNFDPGGFAQYVRVPKLNVEVGTFKLPDGMSFDEGTFIEPFGCVIRAQSLAGLKENQTLLVIGSGISGIMHIKLARARNIHKIIAVDISDARLGHALRLGADEAIKADSLLDRKVRNLNDGRLADVVVVCAGSLQAAKQALECVDRGGTILFFAVPMPDEKLELPINDFWRHEVKIMTSYGASPDDLRESINLVGKAKLVDMITHKLKFDETGKGFKMVAEGKDSLKVIVEPWK